MKSRIAFGAIAVGHAFLAAIRAVAQADLAAGQAVFNQKCVSCHTVLRNSLWWAASDESRYLDRARHAHREAYCFGPISGGGSLATASVGSARHLLSPLAGISNGSKPGV